MSRLLDKVAIISGSSSGLGRAIALEFAAQGTRFVLCADLNPLARSEISDEATIPTHELITKTHGDGKACFMKADMTKVAEVEACVAEATRKGDRLDV